MLRLSRAEVVETKLARASLCVMITFIPHGSNVVEPFFNCGDSMWGVFMPSPGYFGYGGHRAFECAAGFGHHGVVTKMEIQCLNDVGRIIFGAWTWQKHKGL